MWACLDKPQHELIVHQCVFERCITIGFGDGLVPDKHQAIT